MAVLHLLGTGAALSDGRRTTTMLAFESGGRILVIDCGGDVCQRMLAADLDLDGIEALLLTHEHADHVSGFPLLMERLWLAGRRRPLPVYGPRPALEQARRCFDTFDTSGWDGLPDIEWHTVRLDEGAEVLSDEQWEVVGAPGIHSVPVMAFRVTDRVGGGTVAYSADTERSDAIARLAQGADILVHETSIGEMANHTSAEDAAHVARQAGVGRLLLVHIPPGGSDADLEEARQSFPETRLGEDGERIPF
jgi:ribonuclease Z